MEDTVPVVVVHGGYCASGSRAWRILCYMVGGAQTAYGCLPAEVKESYSELKKALKDTVLVVVVHGGYCASGSHAWRILC